MNIYQLEELFIDSEESNKKIRYAMIAFATKFLTIAGKHKCRHIDDLFDATNTYIPFPTEFEYSIETFDQLSFNLIMVKNEIKERYKIKGERRYSNSYSPITWADMSYTAWSSEWLGNELESPRND